jgi:pimeloyl-ACP methyl ester carboxylesterase
LVAGGVGFVELGPDRVLHRLGLRRSPDHRVPPSNRPVVERTIASAAMGRPVTLAMVVPPTPPRGTIVCLHGRGGSYRDAFDAVFVHDVVAALDAPLVVVGVEGGADSYWHPRKDGTDAMALVLDEVLPEVDRAVGAELPHALLGWSMGGYGALLLAERAPERFVAVAAASPALFANFASATAGSFDDESDFASHDVFAGRPALARLAVRVDCGTGDPFVAQARRFAEGLPAPNLGRFSRGYHDTPYWRSLVPQQITLIVGALGP